ncbi:unnamed protein product [Protopolystoma xenopodis]|uniref:Uncharacterized protein n=1 Tax=Protopolystoma xenopodis TaxID=117903 RepID=A0A3S5CSB1_9PLAT|nr:unnamed protein product [Protopolystoma xenopodis]
MWPLLGWPNRRQARSTCNTGPMGYTTLSGVRVPGLVGSDGNGDGDSGDASGLGPGPDRAAASVSDARRSGRVHEELRSMRPELQAAHDQPPPQYQRGPQMHWPAPGRLEEPRSKARREPHEAQVVEAMMTARRQLVHLPSEAEMLATLKAQEAMCKSMRELDLLNRILWLGNFSTGNNPPSDLEYQMI